MKGRNLLVFGAVVFWVSSLIPGAAVPPVFASTVTLKLFSFLPDIPPENIPLRMFMDKVNQKAGGRLVVQYGGGPDAVTPRDLAGATQKGVVTLANHIMSLLDSVVPGSRVLIHNELPLPEFRARALDYIQQIFNEAGLYYLGLAHPVEPQTFNNLFTLRQKIGKLDDFAGLRMASPSPLVFPLYKALKANPVFIPLHNYYVAAERGVIDGFVGTLSITVQMGLYRLAKYVVDYTIHGSPDIFIMNLDAWKKLPKNLQDIMIEAAIEVEKEYPAYRKKEVVEMRKKMQEAGVEFLKFSAAEGEKYLNLNRDASWAAELQNSPERVSKLKALITR